MPHLTRLDPGCERGGGDEFRTLFATARRDRRDEGERRSAPNPQLVTKTPRGPQVTWSIGTSTASDVGREEIAALIQADSFTSASGCVSPFGPPCACRGRSIPVNLETALEIPTRSSTTLLLSLRNAYCLCRLVRFANASSTRGPRRQAENGWDEFGRHSRTGRPRSASASLDSGRPSTALPAGTSVGDVIVSYVESHSFASVLCNEHWTPCDRSGQTRRSPPRGLHRGRYGQPALACC